MARIQANSGSPWVVSRSRRVLDCVVSLLALLGGLPVIALVALSVRLSSRGPVLFRQRRMGRDGKEFILLKFRSMEVSAPAGSHLTVAGDSRVTWMGEILRSLKLDELPQFWNVLKGDMCLVGPRPKLAHLEGLVMPYRPGITGCATLVFRREEALLAMVPPANLNSFYHAYIKPGKVRLDEEYMENATFLSDLCIIVRTAISWTRQPKHPLLEQIERKASLLSLQDESRHAASAD
jgi:lipopolysaccharide/colanic/teichoic acid biosynthesis glycosyltransferase